MATYKSDLMLRPITGGTRTNPNLSMQVIQSSEAVKVLLSNINPPARMIRGIDSGQRIQPVIELERTLSFEANPITRILTGRGAMPLTETTTTTERKPIRRWPRDWHGDNM